MTAGGWTRDREMGTEARVETTPLSFVGIVWTIVFTLRKLGSHFRILSKRVPSFKRLTLAFVDSRL